MSKRPDDQPSIPFRYLRRDRKVTEQVGDPALHYKPLVYTVVETALQWLGPDGVWRDVPTVEEKSDEQA